MNEIEVIRTHTPQSIWISYPELVLQGSKPGPPHLEPTVQTVRPPKWSLQLMPIGIKQTRFIVTLSPRLVSGDSIQRESISHFKQNAQHLQVQNYWSDEGVHPGEQCHLILPLRINVSITVFWFWRVKVLVNLEGHATCTTSFDRVRIVKRIRLPFLWQLLQWFSFTFILNITNMR